MFPNLLLKCVKLLYMLRDGWVVFVQLISAEVLGVRASAIQWRTFVKTIGGDESLQHQLKRHDRVNFWGAFPQTPTAVLLCTLPRFKSFETMNMNFFNYYTLNNIYTITCWIAGTENKLNVFGQIDSPSL